MAKKKQAEPTASNKASHDAHDTEQVEAVPNGNGKNPPAYRTKAGSVYGSVFLAKTTKGSVFPTAIINRRYKGKDDVWKNSSSFGNRDMADLATVVADIKLWMETHYPEQRPQ